MWFFFWLNDLQRLHCHIANCRLLQTFHVVKYRQTICYSDLCRLRLFSAELLQNTKLPKHLTNYVNRIVNNGKGCAVMNIIHIVNFLLTEYFATSAFSHCELQTQQVVKVGRFVTYRCGDEIGSYGRISPMQYLYVYIYYIIYI